MTEQPEIVVCENPDPAHREAILQPLIVYNQGLIPSGKLEPFAVLLRDGEGAVVGGLWAVSHFDWLFVELLFIPEPMRRRGIGTRLIKAAESAAIARGCVGIWLDSFSFQAPGFYRKLGFEDVGTIPDHPKGQYRIIFRKLLPSNA